MSCVFNNAKAEVITRVERTKSAFGRKPNPRARLRSGNSRSRSPPNWALWVIRPFLDTELARRPSSRAAPSQRVDAPRVPAGTIPNRSMHRARAEAGGWRDCRARCPHLRVRRHGRRKSGVASSSKLAVVSAVALECCRARRFTAGLRLLLSTVEWVVAVRRSHQSQIRILRRA